MNYPIYEIVWEDARAINESTTLDKVGDLCIIKSVGYLVKENKKTYCLSQEVHDDGEFRDVTMIPKVNVLKKRRCK